MLEDELGEELGEFGIVRSQRAGQQEVALG